MSFRGNEDHLRDILEAVTQIETFVGDIDYAAYSIDLKSKAAVERQFSILSEAAYRLGKDAEMLCPGPDWLGLRGIGNVLRHAYHRTSDQVLWDSIKIELPGLKQAVAAALAAHFPSTAPSG